MYIKIIIIFSQGCFFLRAADTKVDEFLMVEGGPRRLDGRWQPLGRMVFTGDCGSIGRKRCVSCRRYFDVVNPNFRAFGLSGNKERIINLFLNWPPSRG